MPARSKPSRKKRAGKPRRRAKPPVPPTRAEIAVGLLAQGLTPTTVARALGMPLEQVLAQTARVPEPEGNGQGQLEQVVDLVARKAAEHALYVLNHGTHSRADALTVRLLSLILRTKLERGEESDELADLREKFLTLMKEASGAPGAAGAAADDPHEAGDA